MKYKDLYLLKPLQLYVNGIWIDVLPICKKELSLYVKNISKNKLPLLDYEEVDLYWHFTVAEGRQIRNVGGKVGLLDKVRFIIRSWV